MNQVQATAKQAKQFLQFDVDIDDDRRAAIIFLATLGDPKDDADATKRIVRLLLAGLKRFGWTWKKLGCEPPGPEFATEPIESWLLTGKITESLLAACIPCQPIRDGEPVSDCDQPALTDLASTAARLAYFVYTQQLIDAALVLCSLYWAAMEDLQGDDELGFEDWLVKRAPEIAWNCEE